MCSIFKVNRIKTFLCRFQVLETVTSPKMIKKNRYRLILIIKQVIQFREEAVPLE